MRQAIVTEYFGPTEHRPGRVIAKAFAGKVIYNWNDALDIDENHLQAAVQLANKFGWLTNGYRLIAGGMPCGSRNVYVLTR